MLFQDGALFYFGDHIKCSSGSLWMNKLIYSKIYEKIVSLYIKESENGFGSKGSKPLPWAGNIPLDQIAPSFTQPGF